MSILWSILEYLAVGIGIVILLFTAAIPIAWAIRRLVERLTP